MNVHIQIAFPEGDVLLFRYFVFGGTLNIVSEFLVSGMTIGQHD